MIKTKSQSMKEIDNDEILFILEKGYSKFIGPDFDEMKEERSIKEQVQGVDRVVITTDGEEILFEEKILTKGIVYPHIALEFRHVYPSGKEIPGWAMMNLKCDFILYTFIRHGIFYFIPYPSLKSAIDCNFETWKRKCINREEGFRIVLGYTKGERGQPDYRTENLGVPIPIMQVEIPDMRRICV